MSSSLFQNQQNQAQTPMFSKEQINIIKKMLNRKGMSAESLVRQICTQRGINVNDLINQFK